MRDQHVGRMRVTWALLAGAALLPIAGYAYDTWDLPELGFPHGTAPGSGAIGGLLLAIGLLAVALALPRVRRLRCGACGARSTSRLCALEGRCRPTGRPGRS